MRRREFIAGLGGGAASCALWPLAARAQQSDRLPLIAALVTSSDYPENRAELSAFEEALVRFGWVAGRNVRIEYRFNEGDDARIRSSAAEVAGKAPSVILVRGTQAAVILRQKTSTIPVVFLDVTDPVASGLAATFAVPGGNMTGFTAIEFSVAGKWLGILKDVAPRISRVMFLYNPDNPNWTGYLHGLMAAAPTIGASIAPAAAKSTEEIALAMEAFGRDPDGGVIVVPSGLMGYNRDRIVDLAIRHRLPAVYPFRYYAVSNGLVSYGSDPTDLYRRAASYVDRILKGEKPGDLPIQAPIKFELVLNLKAAKAIGITVPDSLQLLADEVIE
jgi:putative ABC transport system substrate-binding protein